MPVFHLEQDLLLWARGKQSDSVYPNNPSPPICDEILGDVDDRVECLFYLWNLFNTVPLTEQCVGLGSTSIDKCVLYEAVISQQLLDVFFQRDILSHIEPAVLPSMLPFLHQLLLHLIVEDKPFRSSDAASLSDLVLLSWWPTISQNPTNYITVAHSMLTSFMEAIPQIGVTTLLSLAAFPEQATIVMTQLLHLYTICFDSTETRVAPSSFAKAKEDAASKMVGIHANNALRKLAGLYQRSLNTLKKKNTLTDDYSPKVSDTMRSSLVDLLELSVSVGLTELLNQRPGLPLPAICSPPNLANRVSLTRDLFLTQACIQLASELAQSSPRISEKFAVIVQSAAPKHLVLDLLSSIPSQCDADALKFTIGSDGGSFEPNLKLICWSIDHELYVKDYALWFLTSSEPKDVRLADCVLSRLVRHAPILASEHSFSVALITRLDRVRKSSLPEQPYLRLLRHVLSHLKTGEKIRLMQALHAPSPTSTTPHSTPLSNTKHHLDARLRHLCNRITVVDEDQGVAGSIETTALTGTLDQESVRLNSEILMDCELLLLTRPVLVFTELILLPITRRCPASQLAIHQLLTCFSHYLAVAIGPPNENVPHTVLESILLAKETGLPSRLTEDLDLSIDDNDNAFPFDRILMWLNSAQIVENPPTSSPLLSGSGQLIARTVTHLFHLVPQSQPDLIKLANQSLTDVIQSDTKLNKQFQWLLLLLIHAIDQSLTHTTETLEPHFIGQSIHGLIELLDLLFLREKPIEAELLDQFELDHIIIDLVMSLLSRHPDSCTPEMVHLSRGLQKRFLKEQPISRRLMQLWITVHPMLQLILKGSTQKLVFSVQSMTDLCWMMDLGVLSEKLGLSLTTENQHPTEPMPPCLQSTLKFIFSLASISNRSLHAVIQAILSPSQKDHVYRAWSPQRLYPSAMILALYMSLFNACGLGQSKPWTRIVCLLDRLAHAGVLIWPLPTMNGLDTHTPFYLIDWSGLRGVLDLLALFSQLLHLRHPTPDPFNVELDKKQVTCLQFLSNTLAMLTQRVSVAMKTNTTLLDSQYSAPIIRQQCLQSLNQLTQQLDKIMDAGAATSSLDRLRLAITVALGERLE